MSNTESASMCSVCGAPRHGNVHHLDESTHSSHKFVEENIFTYEKLSHNIWKVVEADRHGQVSSLQILSFLLTLDCSFPSCT